MQSVVNLIKQFYFKQQFTPTFWGIFLNPFYFARKGLVEGIKKLGPSVQGKTLDIGCGIKPYQYLFYTKEYIGLEVDTKENRQKKKADYYYDGKTIPFKDKEFNSIVCSQVFEHVFTPDNFLAEAHRVLTEDGVLLLTVPFVWDEHEQPQDFARYSSFGLKYLLNKYNFQIITHEKSGNNISIIFQMFNMYLYKKLYTKNSHINLLFTVFLISPFNILGEILSWVTPKNDDLYLDNIILAKKVNIHDKSF